MHVLFLIDSLDETNCGGAERFAAALATELVRNDIKVSLCTTRRLSEGYRRQLQSVGVDTHSLGRSAKWDIYKLLKLRRILRDSHAQILHTHKFGSNLWGSIFGRIAGVPLVVAHEHSWSYQGNAVRRFLDGQLIGRAADVFVAVNKQDAERMVSYEKVPASKIRVLPVASPAAATDPPLWNVRSTIGLPPNSKIVSVAARLSPEKALEVLLEAMSIVVTKRRDAHLVVIGDGPCRQDLEKLAAELQLSANVHFLGWRDNVMGLLRESDCGALSSDREGMPLFILECLSAGVPVVATDVGAVRELVDDTVTGYVVPRRDPASMAEAVLRVLDDPDLSRQMSAACKSKSRLYTIETVSKQFAGLYSTLAAAEGILP